MFDLDKALAAWLRRYEHDRSILPEDLRELEAHIRDHVEDLMADGLSQEQAFLEAIEDMGDDDQVRAAYREVLWGKLKRNRALAHHTAVSIDMFKSYVTSALRHLRRRKGYTFINVFGLALGIACCGLIALWIRDELAYDRFHADADRIFRIQRKWEQSVNGQPPLELATTAPAIVPLLRQQFPQVHDSFRLLRGGQTAVRYGAQEFMEERVYFAEPAIFDVFTLPLLEGDPRTALSEPFTVVLSERMARKYFGDKDPLGQVLVMDADESYRVTGTMADTPAQSHVHFDFLISFVTLNQWIDFERNWYGNSVYTYVRLSPEDAARIVELEAQFAMFMDRHEPEGNETILRLVPLTKIHLHSNVTAELEPNGSITTVRTFALIAILVLVIAGMNFVNLTTARSTERAKEVGMRKTLGARRGQLAGQFVTESVVLACSAFVLGLLLVAAALPFFRTVSGKELALEEAPTLIGICALLTLLTGALAGSYPAFVLSGYQALNTLRGRFASGRSGTLLRKGLVVFQFTASVALLIGTAVIYRQLDFLRSKDLGFDKEHVLSVHLADSSQQSRGEALARAFERLPSVAGATFSSARLPGSLWSRTTLYREGADRTSNESAGVNHRFIWAGDQFPEVLGAEMVAGRFFSRSFASDTAAIVLNETSARMLGFADSEAAMDQVLEPAPDSYDTYGRQLHIVGVIRDFHAGSLQEEIPPIGFLYWPEPMSTMLVRLQEGDPSEALAGIQQVWERVAGDRPLDYAFVDERFDHLYEAQERTGRLLTGFSFLAIIIASLGLLGLSAFATSQRKKEIGVRKVMGASVSRITVLLSKDFLRLVLVGLVTAVPLAYFAMNRWLEQFAYRIELGPGVFILSGVLALLIALATVSIQTIKAARADPVKSLRYE